MKSSKSADSTPKTPSKPGMASPAHSQIASTKSIGGKMSMKGSRSPSSRR